MCLGLPMRIVVIEGLTAICEGYVSQVVDSEASSDPSWQPQRRRVGLALVGPQPVGSWLLVHIETAMRVIDAEEAQSIGEALAGLEAALSGEEIEDFFPDLIGREPELPPHLR